MRRLFAVAALVAAFVFLAPLMPRAQSITQMNATPCVAAKDLPTMLKRFEENPIGAGLSSDGTSLYYVVVSKSGTFTMIRRDANGMACLIGGGNSWQEIDLPPEGEGL